MHGSSGETRRFLTQEGAFAYNHTGVQSGMSDPFGTEPQHQWVQPGERYSGPLALRI